jgi:MYXO-CTERM domain-containing protein
MSARHITILSSVAGPAALLVVLGYASDARANHLDACGGIFLDVEAAASCEVVTRETCEQHCEPVACSRVCAARLFHQCQSSCDLTAEVDCQASCESSCGTECTTTETSQPPNCMGLCMSDCQQEATADCGDDTDEHGECRSAGAHCCSEYCEGQCDDETVTDCDPVCMTACSGSCEARANLNCQIDCQDVEFESCTTTVTQECHDECQTTGAAIFCDGSFLATGGNLKACAEALAAEFDVHLDVDIDVDVSGSNGDDCDQDHDGDCDADEIADDVRDSLSCNCTTDPVRGLPIGLLALFVIGGWRMRRPTRPA